MNEVNKLGIISSQKYLFYIHVNVNIFTSAVITRKHWNKKTL